MTEILTASLLTILGYFGTETSPPSLFERILWPQRFSNTTSLVTLMKMAIFLPMGGPVHGVALKTLERLRRGEPEGRTKKLRYRIRGGGWTGGDRYQQFRTYEIENEFLVEVLRRVKPRRKGLGRRRRDLESGLKPMHQRHGSDSSEEGKSERRDGNKKKSMVYHLKLNPEATAGRSEAEEEAEQEIATTISEDHITPAVICATITSELIAIAMAIIAGAYMDVKWLAVFFCIPLLFKLCALTCSVRRHGLCKEGESKDNDAVMLEILDDDDHEQQPQQHRQQCFMLLEGPSGLLHQLMGSYGRPIYDPWFRWRDIACKLILYGFVLYFPTGLVLSLLCMKKKEVRYLWLAYQVYTLLTMHVMRFLGIEGMGRTEERIAKALGHGKRVILESRQISDERQNPSCENKGVRIGMTLDCHEVNSVEEGTDTVARLARSRGEIRRRPVSRRPWGDATPREIASSDVLSPVSR